MIETDLIELEEIVFEAPAPGPALVINPDVWVNAVIRDQLVREQERRQLKRMKARNRPRLLAPRKPFLCIACMVGQCHKCAGRCPCDPS